LIEMTPPPTGQPTMLQFPLRVPVVATYGMTTFQAKVLGSSAGVLLLQASDATKLPPLGTLLRLQVAWDRQQLNGRLAAYGANARFLVTLGERAIRRSRRFSVDLAATVRSAHLQGADTETVRIVDLSTSGARIEGAGARLPVGAEVELHFTPPGQAEPMAVHGFVIRKIGGLPTPSVGVAFGLASPVLQLLEREAA
jgi:hypothetical protein